MIFFKKIKKFVLYPFDFLQDFWGCKFHIAEDYRKTENLFVISQMGQLAQYQELIRQRSLKNNVLVILYTKKNTIMPRNIADKADKGLFNSIRLLNLPSSPMKINIKNYIIMGNSYRYLLNRISPKRLFISSFEKHYALLADYAKNKKISINLVEEGTGTYKYNSIKQANEELINNLTDNERKSFRLISNISFYKKVRPALKIFNEFDQIYVAFPSLVKEVFKYKKIHYFSVYENINYSDEVKKFVKDNNFSKNDVLFLSQRYPFPEETYIETLIESLYSYAKNNKSRVFVKLHPKERDETKLLYTNAVKKHSNILLMEGATFSAEELISFSKPKVVLSLASTGLVYTSLISKETQAISIYPYFKKMILKKIEYNDSYFKDVENHYSILSKFPKVIHQDEI